MRATSCLALAALVLAASVTRAEPVPLPEMRWRMIGPFRGGRTKAAAGIPAQPNVFYVGVCNGGVWRTTDYGRTWTPIFDDQPTGSIGAIAVAPSDPRVIYVGSGEGLQRPDLSTGDGLYKSVDGGRSWSHLGLRDGQQIPQIIVDPRDPGRLFVAVLGHPYGPNQERGIFRSRDGGRTFEKVLYRDADTGGVDLAFDPSDARIVYAVLWEARQAPWENGAFSGPGSGLYKSTDGGDHWRPLGKGLPTFAEDGLGRIGITVAPSQPRRLFATVEARRRGGLYRSDDAGESWTRITDDARVTSRASDFAEVRVHPTNPDVVFTASVVTWKSVDGGRTFTALRGAPGGDDYHRIWINPRAPDTMLIASDQGAIVTVNGGQSWSSWYNQPTGQLYHVTTDNAFPYRVCGGQQESGSVCVSSRGSDGHVTVRDWRPVGAEEYAYVAPDPLDPDIVYGGRVTRFDRRTGQVEEVAPVPVAPEGASYRVLRTAPLLFSLADPHALYFASNMVWRTRDGGRRWTQLSPDLTRPSWEAPPSTGKYRGSEAARPSRRGVVYTLAPSPIDAAVLWAGTDDGLVHLTTDGGKHWRDVTPPALVPWAKVSLIDAGRFDRHTAYAAVNTFRLDDLRPHVYRTHDDGRSWTEITAGLPGGGIVNVVREDPGRRGLLFAGSEQAVYLSLDDGEHWQSLRLNMPATSIRDLVVKDDDLVVGTHGRSFWILDDLTPLRQLGGEAPAVFLFRPQTALRVRGNTNEDTPLPPDEPFAANPPEGAILDYHLARPAARVTLEISDQAGHLVRRLSSADPAPAVRDEGNIPAYWIRPPRTPSAQAGYHRFVWDLRGETPAAPELEYPIAAVPGDTVKGPRGPWVVPGRYTVKLDADGVTATQPLLVKMDPRVRTPPAGILRQHHLSLTLVEQLRRSHEALEAVAQARARLAERRRQGVDTASDDALAQLQGSRGERGAGQGLAHVAGQLAALYALVEKADVAPTPQAEAAAAALTARLDDLLARWKTLSTR